MWVSNIFVRFLFARRFQALKYPNDCTLWSYQLMHVLIWEYHKSIRKTSCVFPFLCDCTKPFPDLLWGPPKEAFRRVTDGDIQNVFPGELSWRCSQQKREYWEHPEITTFTLYFCLTNGQRSVGSLHTSYKVFGELVLVGSKTAHEWRLPLSCVYSTTILSHLRPTFASHEANTGWPKSSRLK